MKTIRKFWLSWFLWFLGTHLVMSGYGKTDFTIFLVVASGGFISSMTYRDYKKGAK